MSDRHPHGAGIVRKAHFGAPHELRAVLVGEAGSDCEGRLMFGVPSAVVGDELVTGAALIRCPKVPGMRTIAHLLGSQRKTRARTIPLPAGPRGLVIHGSGRRQRGSLTPRLSRVTTSAAHRTEAQQEKLQSRTLSSRTPRSKCLRSSRSWGSAPERRCLASC